MYELRNPHKGFPHGWLWAAALLPLALVGCGNNSDTSQTAVPPPPPANNAPDEATTVMSQAGLPATFVFGGRSWRGHQVHWLDQEAGTRAAGAAPEGMNAPVGGATGTSGPGGASAGSPGGTPAAGTNAPAAGLDAGYVPVANFQIQGHQIYRKKDADEAVTDNIYLRAEVPAAAGSTVTTSGGATAGRDTTGAAGGNSTAGSITAGNAPAGANTTTRGTPDTTGIETGATRVAYVEYDKDQDLVATDNVSSAVTAAALPETVSSAGKTFRAKDVLLYDPDVFDTLKALPQEIQGHPAFAGTDKDEIILQGDWSGPAAGAVAPGTVDDNAPAAGNAPAANNPPVPSGTAPGNTPAGSTATGNTTGEAGSGTASTGTDAAAMTGPVFIRYTAGGSGVSGG